MIKHRTSLSLLYRHVTDDLVLQKSYYKIILFFSSEGQVSETDINEIRANNDLEDKTAFETKEELLVFANDALEYFKLKKIDLLSNTDFNIGIESIQDREALRELFQQYGTEVKVLESEKDGKGFLDGFFKK